MVRSYQWEIYYSPVWNLGHGKAVDSLYRWASQRLGQLKRPGVSRYGLISNNYNINSAYGIGTLTFDASTWYILEHGY